MEKIYINLLLKGIVMEKMKNMIVIKNIESNLIEEAIIVFKENIKVKQKQNLIKNSEINDKKFNEDYCIKEAQEIISEYIKKIEESKNENKLKIKIKALKILNICLVVVNLSIILFLF